MKLTKKTPFFLLFLLISLSNFSVKGRIHFHKNPHKQNIYSIALPPALAESPIPSPNSQSPSPSPHSLSLNVFDVLSFGAVGDGVEDDTKAFKNAWNSACQSNDTNLILIPSDHSFMIQSIVFTGPCKGKIVFQVDGIVMAPDGPDSWPKDYNRRQWLVFYKVDGISLHGEGLIDGRGQKWWDLPCKAHKGTNGTTANETCDSPVAFRFLMSSNIKVSGIKIQNSPQFHFRFDICKNVFVDSISIKSPGLSPNTDGIHVESTKNAKIYNSIISTGDDCISIGSGSFNVDIQNVTCGPSHGISIGSLGKQNTRACVANVTVRDSVIHDSDNGVRIKTWQGGSGSVSAVDFVGIKMENVTNPIIIDQYYCLTKPCANQTSAVKISDISYSNIRGTYDIRSPPIHFGCSDKLACTNITFDYVELIPAQGNQIIEPFCWNVYGVSHTITIPPISCLLQGMPTSILDDDVDTCL